MKIKMVILLFFFLYSLLFVTLWSFLCVICVCSLYSIVYVLECACFVL